MPLKTMEIKYSTQEVLKGRTLLSSELLNILNENLAEPDGPVEIILVNKNIWIAANPVQHIILCEVMKNNTAYWRLGVFSNNELPELLVANTYPSAMQSIVRLMSDIKPFSDNICDYPVENGNEAKTEYQIQRDALI